MKVILDPAAFQQAVVRQSGKFMQAIGRAIKRQMQALMRQPKSGRTYKFRGRSITASGPGEAPAIRSRTLIRSIREPVSDGQTSEIQVDAPYAGFLEEGTKFMKPRPFVRPAIKTVREQIKRGGLRSLAN